MPKVDTVLYDTLKLTFLTKDVVGLGIDLNTKEYSEAIIKFKEDAEKDAIQIADLLSRPVQPGEVILVDVNIELGNKLETITHVGSAEGKFDTLLVEHKDFDNETRLEITVQNTSHEEARFTAIVEHALFIK